MYLCKVRKVLVRPLSSHYTNIANHAIRIMDGRVFGLPGLLITSGKQSKSERKRGERWKRGWNKARTKVIMPIKCVHPWFQAEPNPDQKKWPNKFRIFKLVSYDYWANYWAKRITLSCYTIPLSCICKSSEPTNILLNAHHVTFDK